ncbi:AgrD family cyclic lactone autoinducer peptide [Desulfofarcimen acetoxidans]
MFRKFAVMMVHVMSSVLAFVAHTEVSPNSWFITYKPDIPESLKNKD